MHAHSRICVQVAVNNGGLYWACLRLTPAVPPTGKHCALFQILRQVLLAYAHVHSHVLVCAHAFCMHMRMCVCMCMCTCMYLWIQTRLYLHSQVLKFMHRALGLHEDMKKV
jgi:hypothetical protein